MKPKIFLICQGSRPFVYGYALAEDGQWMTSHVSSTQLFARADLQTSIKRAQYAEKYPDGYVIVDYTADDAEALEQREDYVAALMRSAIADDAGANEAAA